MGLLRNLVQSSAKLLEPCECLLVQGFDGRLRHGEELLLALIGEGCLESLEIILELTRKLLDFLAESFGRRLQESARNLLELAPGLLYEGKPRLLSQLLEVLAELVGSGLNH